MTKIIKTGSKVIDSLLGGGIRMGMVTDIYGGPGSGKTQLCFTLASSFIKNFDSDSKVLFIDTARTFRPERIVEVHGSKNDLSRITSLRARNTSDQLNAIEIIRRSLPKLVIVDSLTYLFSEQYGGPSRHLAVMNYLRTLAVTAVKTDSAVVVTNMIRSRPITLVDQGGNNITSDFAKSEEREFLESSVSIYSHMKIKLEIVNPAESLFRATLIHPPKNEPVLFHVSKNGVTD